MYRCLNESCFNYLWIQLNPWGLFKLGVKTRGQVCQRNFKQQTPGCFYWCFCWKKGRTEAFSNLRHRCYSLKIITKPCIILHSQVRGLNFESEITWWTRWIIFRSLTTNSIYRNDKLLSLPLNHSRSWLNRLVMNANMAPWFLLIGFGKSFLMNSGALACWAPSMQQHDSVV